MAADAFEAYADFLESLRPQAHGDWAFGEERYNTVLRDAEMLSFDARALRERGRQQIEELTGLLRAGAKEISGSEDWHALLLELNKDRPATPEAMRRGYEDWTERARQFLHDKGLVSFPAGEECAVVPSPPFQRPVLAVASYVAPPSFAETMRGHFFVPYPPDSANEEEIAKRLESNAYPAIPTTAVHEAYPGHHWHLVMAKGNPSHVRQLFGTSYFAEGWALYAERMMEENGFYDDLRHVMYRYEATLFRAARIVVDTSLHLGEMTHAGGGRVHDGQLVHDRADGRGRGDPLLLVAHPGVLVPHRLPGDPAHPGPIPLGPRDRCLRRRRPARLPRRDHRLRHAADRPGRARGDGHRVHGPHERPSRPTSTSWRSATGRRCWTPTRCRPPPSVSRATTTGCRTSRRQGRRPLVAPLRGDPPRGASRLQPDPADPEQALTLAALRQSVDATLALLRADAHAYTRRRDLGPAGADPLGVRPTSRCANAADGRDMVARWRAIAPTLDADGGQPAPRPGRGPQPRSAPRCSGWWSSCDERAGRARRRRAAARAARCSARTPAGPTGSGRRFATELDGGGRRGGATGHGPLPDLHCR